MSTDYPKKYWWVILIAVPVVVALIPIIFSINNNSYNPPTLNSENGRSLTKQTSWPTRFEDIRTAELITSDVDDKLLISVNDHQLQSINHGDIRGPIPIRSFLHRGSNKLTFIVLNSQFGGCGAKVKVYLNGVASDEFSWHWFKDNDTACANCQCFNFNKTLYLP